MGGARVAPRRLRTMTFVAGRVVVGSTRTPVLAARARRRILTVEARGLTRASVVAGIRSRASVVVGGLMPTLAVAGIRRLTLVVGAAVGRLRISLAVGVLRRAAAVTRRVVADVRPRVTAVVGTGLRGVADGWKLVARVREIEAACLWGGLLR